MRLPITVDQLLSAFRWATRIGIGVRAGSRPIGWYQIHQCAALDEVLARMRQAGITDGSRVRARHDGIGFVVEARDRDRRAWIVLGAAREIFATVDRRVRA